MNKSNTSLKANTRFIPADSLLKFGYSPSAGIEFDSVNALLNFSYDGTPKADIGSLGLMVRDGNGVVVGHSAQVAVSNILAEMQVLGTGGADSSMAIGRQSADSGAGNILLYKSRHATIGSSTVVQDGDGLGNIGWFGDDGVDFNTPAAQIKSEVDGTPGSNDMPGRLVFSTTADGASSLSEALRIDSSQNVRIPNGIAFIGDSANANMTVGLTINQGANDDQILAFKSSDIDHGYVSTVETDTWLDIKKASSTLGGAFFRYFAADGAVSTPAHHFIFGGTASTTKTTAGQGMFQISVRETNGSDGNANVTADGNVFAVRARVGGSELTRFLVDEDGDMYSVTAGQTFDDYDDMALIETYDMARSGSLKGQIKADFGRAMFMDEATLVEAGVLGDTIANGGLTNQSQLSRVLTGGVRQLNQKHMSLVERFDSLSLELEAATTQLAALTAPTSI